MLAIRDSYSFALRFLVVFMALMAPWPNWTKLHSLEFRAVHNAILHLLRLDSLVRIEATNNPAPSRLDSKVEILVVDSNASIPNGLSKLRIVEIDTRSLGWIPAAFLFSLVLAESWTWKTRLKALFCAMVLSQMITTGSLAILILHESLAAQIYDITPPCSHIFASFITALHTLLLTHYGPALTLHVLIWLALISIDQNGFHQPK